MMKHESVPDQTDNKTGIGEDIARQRFSRGAATRANDGESPTGPADLKPAGRHRLGWTDDAWIRFPSFKVSKDPFRAQCLCRMPSAVGCKKYEHDPIGNSVIPWLTDTDRSGRQ